MSYRRMRNLHVNTRIFVASATFGNRHNSQELFCIFIYQRASSISLEIKLIAIILWNKTRELQMPYQTGTASPVRRAWFIVSNWTWYISCNIKRAYLLNRHYHANFLISLFAFKKICNLDFNRSQASVPNCG